MSSSSEARSELTPQFCFNTRVLRDFLRTSRSTIDDSITQNLNALVTPAGAGFDPSSTATRQSSRGSNVAQRPVIGGRRCDTFKEEVLFPSWQARSDILNYCAGVATSSDPDDPESVLRQAESLKDRERIVDERLDPYSARFFPREARTEVLANLVRNERSVENIIRERSWKIVNERCGDTGQTWDDALDHWRGKQDSPSSSAS